MAYRLLAGTCSNGPCPTFYVDDETGDVKVQGYLTDSHVAIPDGEGILHIPAKDWRKLQSQLGWRGRLRRAIGR